ncbi:uncharacterized protein MONOS_15868 [Monocercomonoides exilis]|uniref:uncharacterized protein n=1 Tax=Monocercomonoides exilis TaxID=2049356 RepID=UPI00355AADD3|nr:hypothetical protein MONOS_15868 [Monocercomonoides exilis]|eukprot:MONOS_15868.1-p1 / transcript=MONOS_15868.1 / gene=MONOS_15868 / organism=Monocercomonoides_exilis_PA203 / gene_product=unspecified product / transcript_product=unspecified product / location=Mono_scaffold01386:5496-7675(-) / protein_length=545 / sequence_SO=supercontig / SO=protein_coding / is_pseudo=false
MGLLHEYSKGMDVNGIWKEGRRWRQEAKKVYGQKIKREGSVSVCESLISSSSSFLFSISISLESLSYLTFFNISTANDACSPPTTTSVQTTCLMSSCSFTSVYDAYDGGIVHSLNNPFASLTASNTSFIGCCRTRNVECIGTADRKLTPGRQNETENGSNSFIWCEWNGSKATGEVSSYADGSSNGGAICMFSLSSGTLSVKCCSFSGCEAYYSGGGIHCYNIKSVDITNNTFDSCTARTWIGGGMYVYGISSCVRISGCEFQNCQAHHDGGGLRLENIQVKGTGCVGDENGGGESACVFDCSFSSCSLSNNWGGGMCCYNIVPQFKMRSVQFISCTAMGYGGGFHLNPYKQNAPDDRIYCFFLFFHECKCRDASNPYGHDVMYYDRYDLFNSSGNPFHECYTTNTDEQRVCYGYDNTGSSWSYYHTEKKDWLKDKTLYVSVSGNDLNELCGSNEAFPCLTVKKAFEMCEVQISLAITLMEGNHISETTTIDIGSKKISVIGMGKGKNKIGLEILDFGVLGEEGNVRIGKRKYFRRKGKECYLQ